MLFVAGLLRFVRPAVSHHIRAKYPNSVNLVHYTPGSQAAQRCMLTGAAALWSLLGLLAFAVFQGWTADFDRLLLTSIAEAMRAADWPIPLAIAITTVGSVSVRLPLAAFVAGLMLWRGDREGGAIVVITTIGALIVTALLKIAASRARPDLLPQVVLETSFSFPSGHSTSAAAVFGILGWAAVRYGASKPIVWVLVAVLVGLIGLSRIALAVHWPSDVLAGWLLGTGWLLICVSCLRGKLPSRRHEKIRDPSWE